MRTCRRNSPNSSSGMALLKNAFQSGTIANSGAAWTKRYLHPEFAAPLAQQLDVGRAVPVIEEHPLPAVSALGDRVGQPRSDKSRQSCHARNITALSNHVNN